MNDNKLIEFILTNRLAKAFIRFVFISILIFYFSIFFTKGIRFDDTFLRKIVISSDSNYVGKGEYGDIHIKVKGIKNTASSAQVIDIKFPLFFFQTRHLLEVSNPEPSDFYMFMQRISWVVYPVIGTVLMIMAIR
ncbi:MAG: hypothetical protein ACERKZ_10450 [Lachnotalea sp.]